MLFEHTVRLFVGDKGYQTASYAALPKPRREWLRKALRRVLRILDTIETSDAHKELLMSSAEGALRSLGTRDELPQAFSLYLLQLVGGLIGLHGLRGTRIRTLSYWQTRGQHYTEIVDRGGDPISERHLHRSAVAIRRQLVRSLKEQRLTNFEIALALNATEREVARLRRD